VCLCRAACRGAEEGGRREAVGTAAPAHDHGPCDGHGDCAAGTTSPGSAPLLTPPSPSHGHERHAPGCPALRAADQRDRRTEVAPLSTLAPPDAPPAFLRAPARAPDFLAAARAAADPPGRPLYLTLRALLI
jgi:hypothetical protein